MSEPFVGEIRGFSGEQAPVGWVLCQGQLLMIDDYHELFDVIGDQFGGDGRTTFALPALRGTESPNAAPDPQDQPVATRFIIAVTNRAPAPVED